MLQAQRDLNVARNSELLALVEYAKSVVNFTAVQQTPLFNRLPGSPGVKVRFSAARTGHRHRPGTWNLAPWHL